MTEGNSVSSLDTRHRYEIPEGVVLQFRVAGPIVRACAWAIDLAWRSLIYILIATLMIYLGGLGQGIILIGVFLIEWFYPVLFEIRSGATPGKRAMGLVVIQEQGLPVSPSASMIRNLLRTVDFLPFLYATGLVSMLCNRRFQRLGDLAAGTLVVYRDEPWTISEPPSTQPVKPPVSLTEEEQWLLLAFAERGEALTRERREELAGLVAPLTGLRGEAGVNALYAYAHWILKGRR
ncbi:MAG: RDD family protein [Candidatus Thiodiazotropha sp.]